MTQLNQTKPNQNLENHCNTYQWNTTRTQFTHSVDIYFSNKQSSHDL